MATTRVIDELLIRGADDWVMATEVAWLAKSIAGATSDEDILHVATTVIKEVVMSGLMQVGDVTDGGFFEWDVPPKDALERVIREWRALGRLPIPGEVCWLENTPSGDARAAKLQAASP